MKNNPSAPHSPWRTHLLVCLFLLLLAPVHLMPNFSRISTHLPGDVMDTAEYPLNEWWTAHALRDLRINPFNNTYMFHPLGLNLIQHTYTFLDGLFFTLLRPFLSLIVFHNLLIWLTFFANALAAYLLIYYVTQTPWPAFIGALAFGHCPTLLSYYKTAALLEVYNLVFFIFFSYVLVRKRRLIWALTAGLFWGLTLYNYPYYFVFGGLWLVLLIGYQLCPWEIKIKTAPELRMSLWADRLIWGSLIGLILFSVFAPRQVWEFLAGRHLINWTTLSGFGLILWMIWWLFKFQALRKISSPSSSPLALILTDFPVRWNPPPSREVSLLLGLTGVALGVAALVGFPYFQAYFQDAATRQAVSSNTIDFVLYSVDLAGFFAPFNAWLAGLYKIMAPDWTSGRPIVGTPAFLGYGFMVILLWGAGKFFKRPELRLWLMAFGAFLIISLGPYLKIHGLIFESLPLPAYFIRFLPVMESARTLSRYLVPVMLFLCLLVAFIVKPFFLKLSPRRRKIFITGLFLVVGFEFGFFPNPLPLRFSDYRVPEVYQVLAQKAQGRSGVLLDLPLFTHSGSRSAGHGETRRFYYQTVHQQKMIGGVSSKLDEKVFLYFQNQPAVSRLWSLQPVEKNELAALVQAFGIDWIVLDKRYYPPETFKAYRSVLISVPNWKTFYEDRRYLGVAIDQQ
ncbi:MAG: hypothetical protein HY879_10080 [Deltaproteobacteria bacterium]|nr:hypothetical protein [Deltaproteobacteria bacterium]